MWKFRNLGPIALMWGCAPYGDTTVEAWCYRHRCDYVPLAFDEGEVPEGHGGLESALRTLKEASGLELVSDPMGIPIRWVPETYDSNGLRACGTTTVTRIGEEVLSIEIWIGSDPFEGCNPEWMVIRHEIACHALTEGYGHIETGMCAANLSSTSEIDEASLKLICDAVEGCQLGQRP